MTTTTIVNASDVVGTEKLSWANLVGELASLASLAIPVSRTGAVRDPSLSLSMKIFQDSLRRDPESPASANERLCVNPDIKIALWRLVS